MASKHFHQAQSDVFSWGVLAPYVSSEASAWVSDWPPLQRQARTWLTRHWHLPWWTTRHRLIHKCADMLVKCIIVFAVAFNKLDFAGTTAPCEMVWLATFLALFPLRDSSHFHDCTYPHLWYRVLVFMFTRVARFLDTASISTPFSFHWRPTFHFQNAWKGPGSSSSSLQICTFQEPLSDSEFAMESMTELIRCDSADQFR